MDAAGPIKPPLPTMVRAGVTASATGLRTPLGTRKKEKRAAGKGEDRLRQRKKKRQNLKEGSLKGRKGKG